MSLYWIGYDLDKPGQDYSELIRRLQQLGARRILKSDWLLPTTTSNPSLIRDDLQRFLDANDRILVSAQKNSAAWKNLLISDAEVLKFYKDFAN
jgi:hypothetical protein